MNEQTEVKETQGGEQGFTEKQDSIEKQAKQLYEEFGVKADVPKTRGRPKKSDSGDEGKSEVDKRTSNEKRKNGSNQSKPKDEASSDDNDDSGNESQKVVKKDAKDNSKVSKDAEKTGDGTDEDKSEQDGSSERGSSGDSERDDEGNESGEEVKRPGKSSPAAERRIRQLNSEKNEAVARAEQAERKYAQLQQQLEQERVQLEDPEYTLEDFRHVQDENGNILELDDIQQELAYRRWKDGYNERQAERENQALQSQIQDYREYQQSEEIMRKSVEAYDLLNNILENTAELDVRSDKFDKEFSDTIMPLIEGSLEYAPGTEPGNPYGNNPVITGFSLDPRLILQAASTLRNTKRNIPLNALGATVESEDAAYYHSPSSDPLEQAADKLYKMYGIKK
jgi:glutamic acid-rich protein cNBL1700